MIITAGCAPNISWDRERRWWASKVFRQFAVCVRSWIHKTSYIRNTTTRFPVVLQYCCRSNIISNHYKWSYTSVTNTIWTGGNTDNTQCRLLHSYPQCWLNDVWFLAKQSIFWKLQPIRPNPQKLLQRKMFGDCWSGVYTGRLFVQSSNHVLNTAA